MRTTPRAHLALLLVTGLVAGCAAHSPASSEVLERAATAARNGASASRTLAFAGFHSWLVQGDVAAAQGRFDEAISKDPAEPYSLYGQHLLARRAAQPRRALDAALAVVTRAPRHPLAVPSARYVLESVGVSPALDEVILTGLLAALDAGAAGEAAQLLRAAQLSLLALRPDRAAQTQVLQDLGAADTATLLGPFSAWHLLTFDEPLAPEKDGSLVGPFTGPFGALAPRILHAPDSRLDIAGEPSTGDVYLMAADVEVPEAGVYVVRAASASSYKLMLDGQPVLDRRAFARAASTVAARPMQLGAGRHRVLVKLLRDQRQASVSVTLSRADGRPAALRYSAATGPAPAPWGSGPKEARAELVYPRAEDLSAALAAEAGTLLADFIAVRDGMSRDPDGSWRLMTRLAKLSQTPAVLSLRAELAVQDRTIPSKVARGRATRDLEAVLAKDASDVVALMVRAELSLGDNQPTTALETLKTARKAATPTGWPVLLMEARAAVALELDSTAEESLAAALQVQPGLCEAQGLRYNLARRRDAVARTDELITSLEGCPGSLGRAAEHARMRGDMERTAALYREQLARNPGDGTTALSLAAAQVALRRFDDATATLKELSLLWPRNPRVLEKWADVRELAGDAAGALALREQSLLLAGDNLSLRRAVTRAKTGQEVLQAHAINGREAIRDYEQNHGPEDSSAAYVLDAAATQVFPDGSQVSRIHIIQKALEQSGVQEIAEVNLPAGAQPLAVRTLKANGTVLEPESIEGKDSVSLPGVQVGDYVEMEYLVAEPSRGPAQPGFKASDFYFSVANMPDHRATYTVVAPKGTGMKVDAHNVRVPPPTVKGDEEIFTHEVRGVPPLIPEPDGPSSKEYLPFVVVGAGTTGNDKLVAVYADSFLERGALNWELEAFAREAAGDKRGLEAAQALYAAVMKRFSGRDAGLTQSAASTVAQDRGSRMWALKTGLETLGIPTRLAAVRTFSVDPAEYLFPEESLLPYIALRAEVPGSGPVWLDTTTRYAPFGVLPETALGERDAYLLPEPGRALEKVKTPKLEPQPGKQVKLELELDANGHLVGRGEEVYTGYDAAQLAEAFEAISGDRRQQALQNAVGRYFNGAELTELKFDREEQVGAPFTVRYAFKAANFARASGGTLVLPPITMPATLGRQYVQLSTRTVPLLIDDTEASTTRVSLKMPSGYRLADPQAQLKTESPFGRLLRTEKQEGHTLTIDETLRVERGRIAVKQYEDFAHFAGEVDLIQSRDLVLVKQ
ncbi:tetratricopeptide repeat protein [Cystobacter fuscus]|uniref:tetratricopeptide repeat protein n=1 Tax=Cystobacter fuscus TaxID=43 RepID=UPI002B2D26E9|nr:tetratricopeptide repeat protein [Cystobacter fuscus]